MVLHNAKASAILQWFNSLTDYNAASILQMRDGKLFCDVIKSVFNVPADPSVHKEENFTEPTASSSQTLIDLNDSNAIVKRYKFIQEFINGAYDIESGNLIKYEDCEKSDELEIAKVATFILTSIAMHYVYSGNVQLKTLTHLDTTIQEDINDCLSILQQDKVHKLSKEDIDTVLSNTAKYTVNASHRNSITPKRSCSSKYRNTEINGSFCSSPLENRFNSPQFKNYSKKQEEFVKTRNHLCDKEAKIDDLEMQLQETNSLIKEKEREISKLQNLLKRKSKGDYEEVTQCKNCKDSKQISLVHVARERKLREENEGLREEIKRLREELDKMISEYENQVHALETRLEGKRKQSDELSEKHAQMTFEYTVKKAEVEELKKYIEQLKELIDHHEKEVSFLREKVPQTNNTAEQEVEEVPSMMDNCLSEEIEALNHQKSEDQMIVSISSTTQIEEIVVADKFTQTDDNRPLQQRTQYQQISVMQLDSSLDKDLCDPEPLPVCWQMETNVLEAKQTSTELECVAACSSVQDGGVSSASLQEGGASSDTSSSVIMHHTMDCCAMSVHTQNDINILETKQTPINNESTEAHASECNADDASSDKNSPSNLDNMTNKCDPKEVKENSDLTEIMQAPSDRLGSLWIDYNKSVNEKYEETCDSNNKLDLAKLGDLLKQLGISVTEYTSRKSAVKELWAILKQVFAPNGSNGFVGLRALGDWDQSINSDEDQLQCLLYIRESLLKFQNNNSVSKDSTFTEKSCGCHSTYNENLNKLNKEKDDLTLKLTKLQKNFGIQVQKQELKVIDLQADLSRAKEKYINTLNKNEKLLQELKERKQAYMKSVRKKEEKFEELLQKADLQIKDLQKKVENAEKNYAGAVKKKYEETEMLKNKNEYLQKVIIKFHKDKTEFAEMVMVERSKKLKYRADYANMKYQWKKLLAENQNLKAYYQNRSPKLKSETEELELNDGSKVKKSVTDNVRIKEEKESFSEKFETPKKEISYFEITASQFDDSLRDVKPQDRSTQSGALFSKHSFFLPTDDEESYLNHSSIAEIKSENTQRIKELQRRNSIVPPHMRSSYAPEVQCMSPFNRSFFDLVKHPLTKNDSSSSKKNGLTIKVKPGIFSSAKKKRKISELESSNKGLNSSPSWKRRVKNQSSLMKVLYRSHDKPKQQS